MNTRTDKHEITVPRNKKYLFLKFHYCIIFFFYLNYAGRFKFELRVELLRTKTAFNVKFRMKTINIACIWWMFNHNESKFLFSIGT